MIRIVFYSLATLAAPVGLYYGLSMAGPHASPEPPVSDVAGTPWEKNLGFTDR